MKSLSIFIFLSLSISCVNTSEIDNHVYEIPDMWVGSDTLDHGCGGTGSIKISLYEINPINRDSLEIIGFFSDRLTGEELMGSNNFYFALGGLEEVISNKPTYLNTKIHRLLRPKLKLNVNEDGTFKVVIPKGGNQILLCSYFGYDLLKIKVSELEKYKI